MVDPFVVRPLPLPLGRPAPLRAPPRVGFMIGKNWRGIEPRPVFSAAIQTELVRSFLKLPVWIPCADFVGGSFLTFWDHPVVVAVVPASADGEDFEAEGFSDVGALAFWRCDGFHWFGQFGLRKKEYASF